MTDLQQAKRFRFGVFEADATTGELRKQGVRIKVNVQPFQVLLMLLERPGELLTREEISQQLWPDGIFVDYEHGVNSAINRIREALGDTARNPRSFSKHLLAEVTVLSLLSNESQTIGDRQPSRPRSQ